MGKFVRPLEERCDLLAELERQTLLVSTTNDALNSEQPPVDSLTGKPNQPVRIFAVKHQDLCDLEFNRTLEPPDLQDKDNFTIKSYGYQYLKYVDHMIK